MLFRKEYSFLSNFYNTTIKKDNYDFPSLENAYQAEKSNDRDIKYFFSKCSPVEAKRKGKKIKIVDNWEDIKLKVMYDLLLIKFKDDILREKLLSIKQDIIEDNYWNDYYWGVCNGKGENNLGKLLMKTRDFYQNQKKNNLFLKINFTR